MTRTPKATEAKRLARDLASLPRLSREELLARWRVLYGTAPPSHISRPILVRAIVYRMQERVFGGLKPAIHRLLRQVAEQARAGGAVTAAPVRVLKPGTRLLREWQCEANGRIVPQAPSRNTSTPELGFDSRWYRVILCRMI